jgi:hypothetical protein
MADLTRELRSRREPCGAVSVRGLRQAVYDLDVAVKTAVYYREIPMDTFERKLRPLLIELKDLVGYG